MKKEFIDYLYELRGDIQKEIDRLVEASKNQDEKCRGCGSPVEAELSTRRSQISSLNWTVNGILKIEVSALKKMVEKARTIEKEYNWKKAALSDSNDQLKKAFETIETLKIDNEAKSLVIVDFGLDLQRLDDHLNLRITRLENQIYQPEILNSNTEVIQLKVYQEIKKLME